MSDKVNKNNNSGKTFWAEYRRIVSGHGIPAQQVDWFVRWAQDFARSFENVPLRQRSPKDVLSYIERQARRRGIKDWQVKQAATALELLCSSTLRLLWAGNWEWEKAVQLGIAINAKHNSKAAAIPLADSGYKGMKRQQFPDMATNSAIRDKYRGPLEKLRTSLRSRHYSIRTEQSYESWAVRFLTFCENRGIPSLGPENIREYLEFLATERLVAASTQNQAFRRQ